MYTAGTSAVNSWSPCTGSSCWVRHQWGPSTRINVSTIRWSGFVCLHQKCWLECWVPLGGLWHCEVVQLVRECDSPSTIEVASGLVNDEQQLVVGIDVGGWCCLFWCANYSSRTVFEPPYDSMLVSSPFPTQETILTQAGCSVGKGDT